MAAAVYDGVDAVMLSGETAIGHYPAEAVAIMDRIITHVERDPHYRQVMDAHQPAPQPTTADAICSAIRRIAGTIPVAVTVTYTSSGFSALRAARERPKAPILSLTPSLSTARRLSVAWGRTRRAERRPQTGTADGRRRLSSRASGRFRQCRRPGHDRRRSALRPFRHHQHDTGGPCSGPERNQGLIPAARDGGHLPPKVSTSPWPDHRAPSCLSHRRTRPTVPLACRAPPSAMMQRGPAACLPHERAMPVSPPGALREVPCPEYGAENGRMSTTRTVDTPSAA